MSMDVVFNAAVYFVSIALLHVCTERILQSLTGDCSVQPPLSHSLQLPMCFLRAGNGKWAAFQLRCNSPCLL